MIKCNYLAAKLHLKHETDMMIIYYNVLMFTAYVYSICTWKIYIKLNCLFIQLLARLRSLLYNYIKIFCFFYVVLGRHKTSSKSALRFISDFSIFILIRQGIILDFKTMTGSFHYRIAIFHLPNGSGHSGIQSIRYNEGEKVFWYY